MSLSRAEEAKYRSMIDRLGNGLSFPNISANKIADSLSGSVALKPGQRSDNSDQPIMPQRKPDPGQFEDVPGHKRGGIIPKHLATGGVADQYHASGLFHSPGAGRTDILDRAVPTGGYVIPADVVAGIGDGNTLSGEGTLRKMFNSPAVRVAQTPQGKAPVYAKGGGVQSTPVKTAGGEFFVHPNDIIRKFGSLDKGHKILDKWVVSERKKHIDKLKKLDPPKK